MCQSCYRRYGSPVAYTDTTASVVKAIEMVYMDDPVAGACHVVIDDWNLEDEWVESTLNEPNLTETERYCMTMMQDMTADERATALAIHDGFLPAH